MKMLTITTVAGDAFAARRLDLFMTGDDLILARATVINLVLAGKRAGIVVLRQTVDALHGLRSATVVELCLTSDIRVRSGLVDRKAASVRPLGGRFWAFDNSRAAFVHLLGSWFGVFNHSRATANFLTWAITIGRRLSGGCGAASGGLGLDFGISSSLDRRFLIANRLAAAANPGFV
jgi:hypothetical protein